MLRRVLWAVPVLVAAFAAPAFAACPLNGFSLGGSIASALPVDNKSFSGGSASYNIPVGTLQVSSYCSGGGGECGSSAAVFIKDDFTLSGLPPGTSVALTAHFLVNVSGRGAYPAYSTSSAYIRDAFSNVAAIGSPHSNYDLVLPVAAIAGQPFQLQFELDCSNLGPVGGGASGTISFSGMPVGTSITSCQGYTTGGVVAAHESTWGRVKILYR